MRALRYHAYGPPEVLQVEDVPEPHPGPLHAKVRVAAASLNPLDWKVRAGHVRFVPLLRGLPRGTGCDFAGTVVAVGGGAGDRHVGERVFGSLLPFGRDGALAEYVVAPFARLCATPEALDDVHAAALPIAGGTALQALADEACVTAGQRVLITGAAGGVGHFGVQIAKHLGARVTAVCGPGNVAFVRALGADDVVDYTREDFTRRPERYDVVFDAAGRSSFGLARRVLTPDGVYLNTAGDVRGAVSTAAAALATRIVSRQRAVVIALRSRSTLWHRLARLAEEKALVPHVERVIGLADVAQAQREMEGGHARGKIVVQP